MENEMIERVARAMCAGIGFDWPYADEISEREFLMMARAAIAAMREPTEAMIPMDWVTWRPFPPGDLYEPTPELVEARKSTPKFRPYPVAIVAVEMWQSMIDAILKSE